MGRDHKPFRDPRGHSLRIYSDVYDSAAFAALSPHDVLAYLALLRELKAHNNGDLSLPLTRAKRCGIGHLRLPLNFGALSPGFMRRSCAEPPASVARIAWG